MGKEQKHYGCVEHHHHHHDTSDMSSHKLLWVTFLNLSITIVQIIGGLVSNSLSLLSDALHNLGDSSALFIAFIARKRSQKSADEHYTFGYKRTEILAALFNAVVLIAICIFLFFEAYERFIDPQPIKGLVMFIVALFGLFANLISVLVLRKENKGNLNTRAAYLHLMGDTLSSVAVIAGGFFIWFWQIYWIDPLITVLVSFYIIYHTWGVVRQTVEILMQSTPDGIDVNKVKEEVEKLSEIDNIHHLHIWKLDDTQIHLEAHVNLIKNVDMIEMMKIREKAERLIHEKFSIKHITLQMEFEGCKENTNLIMEMK